MEASGGFTKPLSRAEYVFMARLAEQAERYDEMAKHMKDLVCNHLSDCSSGGQLSNEERNLFSVSYKNAIGCRRASWRIVANVEQKEMEKRSLEKFSDEIKKTKKAIEGELEDICKEILELIDKYLLPHCDSNHESAVFFHKMKGDYYRYICEFTTGEKHKEAVKNADEAYCQARKIARERLETTHPVRLGLSLNYSVFLYEIKNDPALAVKEAKVSFDSALTEFDNVTEDSYKDSTLIMQLLRDNMTLWSNDLNPCGGEEGLDGPSGEAGEEEEEGEGKNNSNNVNNGKEACPNGTCGGAGGEDGGANSAEKNGQQEGTSVENTENSKKEFVQQN